MKKTSSHNKADAKRLACPFFKNNRKKYRTNRACAGPGYTTIPRLKEHIYRCHSAPKYRCNRCYVVKPNAEGLQAHQRASDACVLREHDIDHDLLGDDKLSQLRARKKTTEVATTEVQKWAQIFRIIYPDAGQNIPKSYYEPVDLDQGSAAQLIERVEDDLALAIPDQNMRAVSVAVLEKNLNQWLQDGNKVEDFTAHVHAGSHAGAIDERNASVSNSTSTVLQPDFSRTGNLDGLGEFEGGFDGDFDGIFEADFDGDFDPSWTTDSA